MPLPLLAPEPTLSLSAIIEKQTSCFADGGMINNSIFILKKILYINLLWEKTTFVTMEHLCQKRNIFPFCTYLYCVICIVHLLIQSSNTLSPDPVSGMWDPE